MLLYYANIGLKTINLGLTFCEFAKATLRLSIGVVLVFDFAINKPQ